MCPAVARAAGGRPAGRLLPVILAVVAWALTACGGVAPVVKIGLVGPFEGQFRTVGYDVIYSARLAVREINQAGGVGGYRVSLVALDDSGDPALARETATSLAVDPGVVAVVGHWLPETTAAAAPVYQAAGLAFLPAGTPPLGPFPAAALPASFHQAYEGVTPFDEAPGPYAGTAYDAFGLLWSALAQVAADSGEIGRAGVAAALPGRQIKGITGQVVAPAPEAP